MNRLEGSEMAKAAAPKTQDQPSATEAAIRQSQEYLFSIQYPDGYWWAELESNPSMEAEFIMLNHFLGTADEGRMRKVANYILRQQREDGTWGQFYEAPGDLSTTTECYFALKLTGTSPDEPNMRKAREFILSRGGVPATRVFTKIWLAIFGQWSWKGVPLMPPEIMLLPNWFPFNIYEFSSWARATVVPLLVVTDRKPVISIDESLHIDELYPVPRDQVDYAVVLPKRIIGWESFFYLADKLLRPLEGARWRPGRSRGVKLALIASGVLTVVAYQFVIADGLPRIAYLTVLDKMMLVSFALLAVTVVQSMLVSHYNEAAPETATLIDRRSRWLFPLVYALLLAGYAFSGE